MIAVIASRTEKGRASRTPSGLRPSTRRAEASPRSPVGARKIATATQLEWPSRATTYISRPTWATAKPEPTGRRTGPAGGGSAPRPGGGGGGGVGAALPGFEAGDEQITLARAAADALDGGEHLLAEAGTGTGKSLAYLLPALASGQRVVVAT